MSADDEDGGGGDVGEVSGAVSGHVRHAEVGFGHGVATLVVVVIV